MMIKFKDYTKRDGFAVVCLLVPSALKYILPSGIEGLLYLHIGDICYLFIPNLLMLLCPFLLKRNNEGNNYLFPYAILCVCAFFSIVFSNSRNILMNLTSNTFLYGALYIGLFKKLTQQQLKLALPILVVSDIWIALQFVLFSTSLLYLDVGDVEEFGGILRIDTTAGASTGACVLLALHGVLICSLSKNKYLLGVVIPLTVVGVFFSMTRSGIYYIVAIFGYVFLKYFRKRFSSVFYVLVSIIILSSLGVFNPILERIQHKKDYDITDSGRNELMADVLTTVGIENAYIWGLGTGNVYATTEVRYANVTPVYEGAPHNSFLLLFAEQGLIGLILLSIIILIYIKKNLKYETDLTIALFLYLGTAFMAETVVIVNSEYVFLLSLLFLLINSKFGCQFVGSYKK